MLLLPIVLCEAFWEGPVGLLTNVGHELASD
jgi:hypothetical protein